MTEDDNGDPEAIEQDSTAASDAGGDTTIAAITHILGLFTWLLGPAVILLVSDDEYVKQNARNAINWQIFFAIYMLIGTVLTIVVVGFLIIAVAGLLNLVFCLVAAVKGAKGEAWSYPLSLELLS